MAESITFRVGINPRVETVSETAREGGSVDEVILSATEAATVRSLKNAIQAAGVGADATALLSDLATMLEGGDASFTSTIQTLFKDLAANTEADLLTAAGVSLIDKTRILEATAPTQWDATNKETFDDLLDTVTAADFGADVKTGLSTLATMLQTADASFTSTMQTAFKNFMTEALADGMAADDIEILSDILVALAANDASWGASHKDAVKRLVNLIILDTDISSVISAIAALE